MTTTANDGDPEDFDGLLLQVLRETDPWELCGTDLDPRTKNLLLNAQARMAIRAGNEVDRLDTSLAHGSWPPRV